MTADHHLVRDPGYGPIAAQVAAVVQATDDIWRRPPAEVLRLYLGMGRAGAGPVPQVFTTWNYVREDTRWICQHALPPIIGMLERGEPDRDKVRIIANELFSDESEFLSWLGLPTLAGFLADFLGRLDSDAPSLDLARLGVAVEKYTHRLQNWTTHYFPWGLGAVFPQRAPSALGHLFRGALSEVRAEGE